MVNYSRSGSVVGSANTQLVFTLTNDDMENLALVFKAAGGTGVFASQNVTVAVSSDNSTFYNVDTTVGLGTGSVQTKYYDENNKSTTLVTNIMIYPFVKITVPALGTNIVCTVEWNGRTRYYH